MRKLYALAAVILTVSILSCQDSKEDRSTPDIEFQKSIGMQIPVETGMRWIDTYNKKNNISGRDNTSPYSISASQLNAMRLSVLLPVGIAFHHAYDNDGNHHIIAIPVDLSMTLWSGLLPRTYVDANTNTQISRSTAMEWTQNYVDAHPGEIWFHFFGNNIFDEITSLSFFNDIEIEPAINDENLTPQLLLIVAEESEESEVGRTQQSSMAVYDASSPCPPCPVNR
jgi:hypothetical protein